jgi:hypothetical protein
MDVDATGVAAKFLTQEAITIAHNLHRTRRGQLLSLSEAAVLIDTDRHELQRMELGIRTVRSPSLTTIAYAYGVSVDSLKEGQR